MKHFLHVYKQQSLMGTGPVVQSLPTGLAADVWLPSISRTAAFNMSDTDYLIWLSELFLGEFDWKHWSVLL